MRVGGLGSYVEVVGRVLGVDSETALRRVDTGVALMCLGRAGGPRGPDPREDAATRIAKLVCSLLDYPPVLRGRNLEVTAETARVWALAMGYRIVMPERELRELLDGFEAGDRDMTRVRGALVDALDAVGAPPDQHDDDLSGLAATVAVAVDDASARPDSDAVAKLLGEALRRVEVRTPGNRGPSGGGGTQSPDHTAVSAGLILQVASSDMVCLVGDRAGRHESACLRIAASMGCPAFAVDVHDRGEQRTTGTALVVPGLPDPGAAVDAVVAAATSQAWRLRDYRELRSSTRLAEGEQAAFLSAAWRALDEEAQSAVVEHTGMDPALVQGVVGDALALGALTVRERDRLHAALQVPARRVVALPGHLTRAERAKVAAAADAEGLRGADLDDVVCAIDLRSAGSRLTRERIGNAAARTLVRAEIARHRAR